MKPEIREQWIVDWLKQNTTHQYVDVLNADFVWGYITATGAKHQLMMFGAPKCKQLSKDLSDLYSAGVLTRCTVGLAPGDSSMGFPKWVYSYRMKGGI